METHLGLVGKALGCSFVNPIFESSTEREILGELDRYAVHVRGTILRKYLEELGLTVEIGRKDTLEAIYDKIAAVLTEMTPAERETLARVVAAPPAVELPEDLTNDLLEQFDLDTATAVEDYDVTQIVSCIERNVAMRGGVNPKTGKFRVRGRSNGRVFQPGRDRRADLHAQTRALGRR